MTTTRNAETRPHLDLVDTAGVRDLRPAETSLLANIDTRQLALMSAWGNPPIARSCYLKATGSTTWTVPLRVPPGVTEMDLAFLSWGLGSIAVTCSADAVVGTKLYSIRPVDESLPEWVRTSGAVDPAGGSTSARSLTVSASVVWSYQDIDLTVTIADITTECGILGIVSSPVWRPWTL